MHSYNSPIVEVYSGVHHTMRSFHCRDPDDVDMDVVHVHTNVVIQSNTSKLYHG